MRFKTLTMLLTAVGCGLVASYLTARLLSSNPEPATETVLVARQAIPRGTALADCEALFEVTEVSRESPLPLHYVRSREQLREKAKDHLLQKALKQGEPLSLDYLVDRGRSGLAYLLRPGYVAFALRATPESSFAGLIKPDNHVKVIWVKPLGNGDRQAQILMKNIRVAAVERELDKNTDRAGPVTTITLEVTDAEWKLLSQHEGSLSLALVAAPDEKSLTDRRGEEPLTPQVRPSPPARTVVKPKTPPGHLLTIISGEKSSQYLWDAERRRFTPVADPPCAGEQERPD